MITILKNILKFITDPKNTRMIMLGIIVVVCFLFLRQCNKTKYLKGQVELERQETKRVSNNYEAAMDTVNNYKFDDNTWRAEKSGYELTIDELKNKYADLLGDFEVDKNKPPKVIIKTEYVIREIVDSIPVLVEVDGFGNTSMTFYDSTYHDSINYRLLSGRIPYKIILDTIDSTYKAIPDFGEFNLTLGMNLNLGLFQDKKTRKISIIADTDYPGVNFTNIEGASIMDDPLNKKILRDIRKSWGIGINVGYGFIVDPAGIINAGPYVGVGLNYTPKLLQFGK